MFFALTGYACFTKKDVTVMGGLFSSLIHLIILTVILGIFIADIVLWRLVVCTLVICLLSVYIVWDTQMIVGGKGKHQAH